MKNRRDPWLAVCSLIALCLFVLAFASAAEAQTYEKVFSFTEANAAFPPNKGARPRGGLIRASDGNFYGTTVYGGAFGYGTAFKTTSSGVLTTLAEFSYSGANNKGVVPVAGLVQGNDGNFYGTTFSGGTTGWGTAFKITPAGVLTTLVEFTYNGPSSKGIYPLAAMVLGTDGNFYGTTQSGGTLNCGTVYKLTPAGVMTTLVEFTGNGATNKGTTLHAALVLGSDGNFYGTTVYGGTGSLGTVFKMTPAGGLTTLVNFTGNGVSSKGSLPYGTLVQGSDGNFYGTTYQGGNTDNGTLFKMTPAGGLTTLVEFTGNGASNRGSHPYAGLIQGSDGSFYGTTNQGGTGNYGTVFKVTSAGVLTTLIEFTGTGPGNNGSNPYGGLILSGDGNFYGTTEFGGTNGFGTIFKITAAGVLTTLLDFTSDGASQKGSHPYAGLVQASDGSFFGTTYSGGEANKGTVFKLTPGGILNTLLTFTGTSGTNSKGANPFAGVVKGTDGNFYGVTETGGTFDLGTVFRLTPGGAMTTLVEFTGTSGASKGGKPAGELVQGTDGNFYGTTQEGGLNNFGTVFKMTPAAVLTTLVEFTENGASNKGSYPYGGLIQHTDGNFYGTTQTGGSNDQGTVFKMTPAGVLTTLAAFNNANGELPQGRLVVGNDGNFYGTTRYGGGASVDVGSGIIFRMTPAGALTTLVSFNYTNGGVFVKGSNPSGGLVLGSDGNFYGTTPNGGADNNGTVFKMTPAGVLTTIFEFGGDPLDARPSGKLIFAADGNLYGTAAAIATGGSGSIFRFVYPGPPAVYSLGGAGEQIQSTAAVISAKVNARGSATTSNFEYGTDGINFPNILPMLASPLNGYLTTTLQTSLSGLTKGTTYYYRIRAASGAGTTLSPVASFSTLAEPVVTLGAASGIAPASAQLNGTVDARNYDTTVRFEYGTDGNSFPNAVPASPGTVTGAGSTAVNAAIAGLTKGATYYYRIVASNAGGTIVSGATSFATLTDPVCVVGSATFVTSQSATLNGTVNAKGAVTSVTFEYGTDGINFPNSVGATPPTVTGNSATAVSAVVSGLAQGTTYYFRVKGTSAGGVGVSASAQLTLDILSGFARVVPAAPPPAQGFMLVTLTPSGIASGWRFVGEQQWRASGIPVGGLASGDRQIEFRPVPGYIQPLKETVAVTSGGAAALFTGEYFLSASGGATGGLNVVLKPDALADPLVPVAQRAQWRLLGEDDAQWRNSGVTIPSLVPGIYLVECKPVNGRTTPPPIPVAVTAGSTRSATLTYALADASAGTPPSVLTFETVNNNPNLPYAFVGQIRSDVGAATGFVVKPRVVATAAHVVFDDGALAYVTGLQWLFQRDAGTYEPKPQVPRGFYIFNGYAAQRSTEATPGQSSPQSQNLDAAALYFLEDAGRGGYGGYLGSDRNDNEFLISSKQKMLVGYPIDGIASANQGRMHATLPANVTFANAFGHTFTTADIRSSGGNSGGPLAVQFDDGKYYAAAIYLGGSAQTVVRSIDSGVIDLFNRAETSGNGGANNTGGGISQVDAPFTGDTFALASLTVYLQPAEAVAAGAAWQLGGATLGSGAQRSNLTPGSYTVSFTSVSGFQTPSPMVVTLSGGNVTQATGTYTNITPPKQDQSISFPGLPNRQIGDPAVGLGASASSGLPVSYSLVSGPGSLSGNSVTPTGVGTVTIRASQSGNGSFNPAPDVDQSFSVGKASQTISFGGLGGRTFGDAPFAVGASASSGLPVSFSAAGGPASVSGSTVTLTGAGTVTIRASQSGNGSYNAAPDVDQSFSVARANQSISFGGLGNKTYGEPGFTVSASATSGLAPSFSVASGPASVSGNTVTLTGAGSVTIRASQAGNGNYNAAPDENRSFSVGKAGQSISFGALATRTYGESPFGVGASASSGLIPSLGIVSGPATISGNTVTLTGAGTVTIRASQGGDNNYNAAASVDQGFNVNKATPLISWPTPTSITYGTALSGTQLNATANVAGTFTYAPAAGAVPGAGSQPLSVTFSPSDTTNYSNATGGQTLIVNKATLSAKAEGKTKAQGDPNPALTILYTGFVNGDTSAAVTVPPTAATTATTASIVGSYPITLTGGSAVNYNLALQNGILFVYDGTSPVTGIQSVVGTGYVSGGTVTVTNTVIYSGTLTGLGWSVLPPNGWSYAAGGGSEGDIKPNVGDTSLLEWGWTTIPPSLVTFTYTLTVPAGTTGPQTLAALVRPRQLNTQFDVLAQPDPLTIDQVTHHTADTSHDFRFSLSELLRVIELYNTRNGTVRTGAYAVDANNFEDGFAPDAARLNTAVVSLLKYHAADLNHDGKLGLSELLRVIELYNYRNGTVRTGQYHVQAGTEDSFAPGP